MRICGEALQDMKNVNIVYVQLCHNFYQLVDQLINYSETERNCIDNLWKRLNRFCPCAGDWIEFCKRRQRGDSEFFFQCFLFSWMVWWYWLLERDQALKALAFFVKTSSKEMGLRPTICSKAGSTFAK